MRPIRLELQGFASFRDHTVLDFTDADLFVLAGPTGAGKSSIVDAVTFALYGSVARYDDARLVEPVISQGLQEARVLLDFTADGVAHRVARRVARTKGGGATTKEARLERLPEGEGADPIDLASGAKEVSAEVEALLGLSFAHFCRTVVLPQGAFQDFLHAKAADRQELLVRLLDLGVYRDVARRARRRAEDARAALDALLPRLEQVAGVTPEAIATVRDRLARLDQLALEVAAAQPGLEAIREQGAEARAAHAEAARHFERVEAVRAPEGLDQLAERLAGADRAVAEAGSALEAAASAREAAEDALEGRPGSDRLQHLLEAVREVPRAAADHEAAIEAQDVAAGRAAEAAKLAAEADAAVVDAREALRRAESTHRVHALRDHLAVGEACPLCEQAVTALPDAVVPADLDDAHAAVRGAEAQAERTRRAAGQADVAGARAVEQATAAEQRVARCREQAGRLAAELGLPEDVDEEAVTAALGAAREAERALADARVAEREARTRLRDATSAGEELDGERRDALARQRTVQASVADLGAPAPDGDLAASWRALVDWAHQEAPRRRRAVQEAAEAVDLLVERWREHASRVRDSCARLGVEVPEGGSAEAAVATARAEAAGQLEQLEARSREALELRQRVDGLRGDADVARLLGQLLDARHFEQWLLARGLTRLVVGASMILGELSQGAYSLALADDNAFRVVDHRNADQERHARSLSGGETFLASLALALSLAEHVTDLAARGSARLEALFLDEGFGTLDADTLDTVAASIEELGASGRMVGVITHVQELAARIPTRFEVRKGPGGSTVQRVEA